MKIALKTLSIIVKVITSIMAIIGVIMTGVVIISTKMYFKHVDNIIDEDGIDADEDEIASKACARSILDDDFNNNPVILLAAKVFAPVVHLVTKF